MKLIVKNTQTNQMFASYIVEEFSKKHGGTTEEALAIKAEVAKILLGCPENIKLRIKLSVVGKRNIRFRLFTGFIPVETYDRTFFL